MTKVFAGLFLLVILYTTGGYLIVFTAMRQDIRNQMVRLVERESNSKGKDIKCLTFAKKEIGKSVFIKSISEFTWKGDRYDIAKQIVKNDSVHFYCIRDKKEENLYSGLRSNVRDNSQSQSSNQAAGSFTFKMFSIGFFFETPKKPVLKFEQTPSLSFATSRKACSGYSHLFTPPPKNNLS